MIQIQKQPGQRVLELGCGETRNPSADVAIDVRPIPGVTDFSFNLEETPWPIKDADFFCVLAEFVLEHVTWSKVKGVIAETFRVLQPGGAAVFTVPNTEAQLSWIQMNQGGWDGKDLQAAASELIFGSQNYSDNAHKAFFSPGVAIKLFSEAGFQNVTTRAYGARSTDLSIECRKPIDAAPPTSALCGHNGPQGAICKLAKGHLGNHVGEIP